MLNLLRAFARVVVLTTTMPLASQVPDIQAKVSQEDGRPVIVATIMADQKPVKGATVIFSVHRNFGDLKLGEDTTLEDGTAAVSLPKKLPAGPGGKLILKLEISAPATLAGTQRVVELQGPAATGRSDDGVPRALMARRAPLLLLLLLALIVGSVWSAYAVVTHHLFRIKKGDLHA